MRTDSLGPRTWALGAVAAWAVLAWVLALFGLGGYVAPLPDDPALAAELPQWRDPAAERIGPLPQYAAIGERPLFNEDRQPRPFYIEGEPEAETAQPFDFVLSSVLIAPGLRMAMVQRNDGGEPVRMKLGEANDALPGWTLAELSPRSAVFDGPQGRRTLELRVYGGSGGPPPTTVADASAAASNAAPAVQRGTAPPVVPATGNAAAPPAAEAPAMTSEQQMQAIRQRIEARRRQLREQQTQQPTAAPAEQKPR